MTTNSLMSSILDGTPAPTAASRDMAVLDIKAKITELSTMLLAENPQMPILLRTIHNQLRTDPELVTIISEEEIGLIVNGLKKQTKTELITTTVKASKSAATKKAISKFTTDDL